MKATNLSGISHDKTKDRWRFSYQDQHGVTHEFSRKSRAAVEDKRKDLSGDAPDAGLKLKRLPAKFDGSAAGLKSAIADAVRAANHAAIDGKAAALKTARAYIATLKDASTAIVPHSEYVKLEEEHAALIAWVEELKAGKIALEDATKSTVLSSPARTLQGRTRPGDAIH